MEEDADWDVRIRSQLDPNGPIALGLRSLESDKQRDGDELEAPYGLSWDVLLLGHCGYEVIDSTLQLIVNDMTMASGSKYRSEWSSTHYQGLSEGERLVLANAAGLCTFGYAVTQQGARRLLELNHWDESFDVLLIVACKDGRLKCNAVAPELIHHQRAVGKPSIADANNLGIPLSGTNRKGSEQLGRFTTTNIVYSARCNALPERGLVSQVEGSELVQCLPTVEEFESIGN